MDGVWEWEIWVLFGGIKGNILVVIIVSDYKMVLVENFLNGD